ncbi:MAG: UrcA family protein [Pseudomonadales bacterium]|nr:UrcA family protein [Pseudomonadales bacterium]MBO6565868.1 UrcA family protein [Pseudomonadales bacterium]MBO6595467.1 UrcA family protein [Pseudomonadales bacterium]MBO6657530.1 UrcA family protein [Pseudomonadales bacterium]MBO6701967.1 UrcA family protein [Pseudomonadales bacterium]
MKIRQTFTTAITAAALSLSLGANAAMIKGTHGSVSVDLADLDLTTVDGQQIMHARIKKAAKEVCGSQDYKTAGSLENYRKNKACFNDAVTAAADSVDHRYLTAAAQ